MTAVLPSGGARAWLRAARPLAHGNIAPPILLGQALGAVYTGRFSLELAALAFGFGILNHLTIVFANDYADREADSKNHSPTFFSGGSRVIPEGLLAARSLSRAALAAAVGLCAWSVAGAVAFDRPALPALAAAALVLLHAYSFPPLRLSYRGFGEILQALGVGLVLPLVGFYAQTGSLSRAPLEAFAPLVVLGFAGNLLSALPDADADRAAGKRTWPVHRGVSRAGRDAIVLTGLAVALATQASPPLEPELMALAFGPAALVCMISLTVLRGLGAWSGAGAESREASGGPEQRSRTVRLAVLGLGAGVALQIGWAAALLWVHA